MMADPIKIVYSYQFKTGSPVVFNLKLDRDTLGLMLEKKLAPPLWTLLNHKRCENCPLDEKLYLHCPVALNFADIAEPFKDMLSHEKVMVAVMTEERTFSKETMIQHGLSPLVGIIMTTSGCPIMEHLKPMVRFHLPFASLDETIFRMVSMYLLVQYYRSKDGKPAGWNLDGLMEAYAKVSIVNRDFANRLRDAAKKDANINALVNLDCFAAMMPFAAEETLKNLKQYFGAYLQ
ncbi:MAG: hypothetical protein A2010_15625 [Nitrospirae bacterium GWD2_57_9]|nr:MAG: hypothetical protein A2010_15625 [Nitrospirae bacterium GWD2_57_9]OGW45674.1 MAG: hypothetical protein A2078_10170 [Nitrospirae bacterium GWC2_57_9]